ncbi:MAG: aminoacyl-tRNA hydrolase [Bryobacteraceae bacterium]|nr:aminoacyl-tRNA hydrolase [Bryobacterales bacterium]NUN00494.1 aminoacyl-tRNA hydrolase [Bryobacteraceae bacterium]
MDKSPVVVVGLGNPGPEYEFTPHNLGFLVVDRIADRNTIRISRKESMALVGQGRIADTPVVLAKPQTFMNLSGSSVKPLLAKLSLGAGDLVVVYDDLDLPWGGMRIRPRGSAGGHHGVESLIRSLGTSDFPRLRLGVDPGHPTADHVQFLLSPMRKERRKELDELLDYAAQAVESIIAEGVEKSMTKFNRRAQGS